MKTGLTDDLAELRRDYRRMVRLLDISPQWGRMLWNHFRRAWARRHESHTAPFQSLPLLDWARHFLPHYIRRPYSLMHRWLGEQLDRLGTERGARLNVLGPRGGAKSTLVTLAYALRMAVEGREPYLWIVCDSKSQAALHLDHLRHELTGNPTLARAYPAATGQGTPWRRQSLRLRNNVVIDAFGSGQALRGRRRQEHRPTLIVCDDVQSERHALSAPLREQSRQWFHAALLKAGTKQTNVVHLATALHREALGLELTRTAGWRSRIFRAIEQWPERMDLWAEWGAIYSDHALPDANAAAQAFFTARQAEMTAGAIVLWPEEEDLYTLMCQRATSGAAAFEREKQNSPLAPELCEWPESYFAEPLWFEAWPAATVMKVMAIDPSKGRDDRSGDYSAIVLLAVADDGTIFVEADLARRPTTRIVTDGVSLAARFRPWCLGIEANQFQELLAGELAAELRRQGLVDLAPIPLLNTVSKLVRIRRLGPLLAAHRVRFLRGHPGTRLLVDQLRDFPVGDHDDGPDALEMALRLAADQLSEPALDDGLGNRLITD